MLLLLGGCRGSAGEHRAERALFRELETPSFVHDPGADGRYYFPEIMSGGGALFDADGDGDLDLYAVQGAPVLGGRAQLGGGDRLFRNQMQETGTLTFVDVTEEAGLEGNGYGVGATVGDYDNDGRPDLYVLRWGRNELWRSRADGTFEEVATTAGVADPGWSTSATFFDYDGDGWLDLYVANYVEFDVEQNVECFSSLGIPDYCSPLVYEPAADSLFRNRGDGTFEDVSIASGVRRAPQNGLGVVSFDANGDGLLDLYVTNDMTPNHLWIQRGGRFEDEGLVSGAAVNRIGRAEASMGVTLGDVDGDGDEDLIVTHLRNETHTLYLQDGAARFVDATDRFGLGSSSVRATGFGVALIDLERDGWLDLMIANGSVTADEELSQQRDPLPFHEPDQIFSNQNGEGFVDVTARGGTAFERSEVGRGVASGDLDDDGDRDLVIFNNSGPLRVLIAEGDGRWVGADVFDERYGRAALGAVVTVELDDGRRLVRRVGRDGSYAVASDPRAVFGLGAARCKRIVARWPDGWEAELEAPAEGRYHRLVRSAGDAP